MRQNGHGRHTYTVSEKNGLQYSRHNFETFRHGFVIFGTNHPDTSLYLKIRKLSPKLQRRDVEMTSYMTSKLPFTDMTDN